MTSSIVILNGAGISAGSGMQTSRGAERLWEGTRLEGFFLSIGSSGLRYPAAGLG